MNKQDILTFCPICEEGSTIVADDTGDFKKCTGCQLVMQCRMPKDPARTYEQQNYDKLREQSSLPIGVWERYLHDLSVGLMRIKQLDKKLPDASTGVVRWVDFGTGNGAILTAASRKGYAVTGVESDEQHCKIIEKLVGIPMMTSADYWKAPKSCDIFSVFDVIEHLLCPVDLLRRALSVVSPGGVVVIEVPDVDQCKGRLEDFAHHKPDEHIFHFGGKSLERMRQKWFPHFSQIHENSPIPLKIQVVWRRKA